MRGTAFSLQQFVQVTNALNAALPQVLCKYDPSAVIAALEGNSVRLEDKLDRLINKMIAPSIVHLGEFTIDYDVSIVVKLAAEKDPQYIGWRTEEDATDEKFPDVRTGKKRYKARAVRFNRLMAQDAIERWCVANGQILARPKDGIDIACVSPRPKLDNVMPLVIAGQFCKDLQGWPRALVLKVGGVIGDGRGLMPFSLVDRDDGEEGKWRRHYWFLTLQEIPLIA